jgi:hypothetical protein
MADISDVVTVVTVVLEGAVYPNGLSSPSVGACPVIIYGGWPDPGTLQDDLAAGKVHVSVFPRPGGKVTTTAAGDTEWTEVDNNGTAGTSALEIRRQDRSLQITVWANTPELRDRIAKNIDPVLAMTTRLAMPDGSQAIMTSVNDIQIDAQQKSGLYRRDLIYSVNYATTFLDAEYAILATVTNLTTGPTLNATGPAISRP